MKAVRSQLVIRLNFHKKQFTYIYIYILFFSMHRKHFYMVTYKLPKLPCEIVPWVKKYHYHENRGTMDITTSVFIITM
jgi:hypothetical protein